MNDAPTPTGRLRRALIAGGAVLLLLVGVLMLIPPHGLPPPNPTETTPAEIQDARLQALAARLAELAGHVESRQAAVPLARYEAESRQIEQRLTAIEQTERPSDALPALRERLARLEARQSAQPASPPPPPAPKIAAPSFQVIGVERRADERFLALLPLGAQALTQVRLLRVGDEADGWRLAAIDAESATFRQGRQRYRLSLTGGAP